MRSRENDATPLSDRQRPCGAGGDPDALAGRGQITLLLPARIALDLVARIEAVGLEQALGQAQRHSGVIRPRASREIEWPTTDHVAHGGKCARAAELRSRSHCISDSQTEKDTDEALA